MNVSKVMTLAGALAAPFTFSAGFMLNEQGVSSLARGNAGRGVVGDNASDIAANPATSALFSGQAVSGVFHYIDPNINVEGTNQVSGVDATKVDASEDDIAPSAAVPGFYYVLPIDDQFSFGLSLNSFFGMSTDYPSDFAGSEHANKTSIKTYYVTPSFAWKINDQFSVGLGVSYIYGKGEIKSTASAKVTQAAGFIGRTVPEGTTLLDIDGDGAAFGWNIGGIYSINNNHRLGLAYRSDVDLDADADVISAERIPGQKGTGEITFNLPGTLEFSYFGQLNEIWAIAAGVQWIHWSRFEDLTIDIDNDPQGDYTFKKENWDDSYRLSLGADYRLNSLVNFHAGYTFDKSPVPSSHRTLTIPDADRNWLTLGATLDFETAGLVDLAFAYIKGKKVNVKEDSRSGTTFDGKLTKTDAMVFSVGYSYNF